MTNTPPLWRDGSVAAFQLYAFMSLMPSSCPHMPFTPMRPHGRNIRPLPWMGWIVAIGICIASHACHPNLHRCPRVLVAKPKAWSQASSPARPKSLPLEILEYSYLSTWNPSYRECSHAGSKITSMIVHWMLINMIRYRAQYTGTLFIDY